MSLNPSTYSIFPEMWSELLLWLNMHSNEASFMDQNNHVTEFCICSNSWWRWTFGISQTRQYEGRWIGWTPRTRSRVTYCLTGWSFILNNSIVTSQTQQGAELRLLCMDYDKWEIQFAIGKHYFAARLTRSESPNGKCIYL